jgi:4'-phosphopantetheinyl transferase
MLTPGMVTVWRAHLDSLDANLLPPPQAAEAERAVRFHTAELRERYLRAHRTLRAILAATGLDPVYRRDERGKPYLPAAPNVHFNLSHSHGMALYAIARDAAVGVDVERHRALAEHMAIAERFLPPSFYAAFLDVAPERREREFIAAWTRVEAALKALGVGLYGAGQELAGEWTMQDVDAGDGFAAAVAVRATGFSVTVKDFTV